MIPSKILRNLLAFSHIVPNPITLCNRLRQTHGLRCRGTGYNSFDTMRSPGYQGQGSCQQRHVRKHDHVPGLCLFSACAPTTGISVRHKKCLYPQESCKQAVRDLWEHGQSYHLVGFLHVWDLGPVETILQNWNGSWQVRPTFTCSLPKSSEHWHHCNFLQSRLHLRIVPSSFSEEHKVQTLDIGRLSNAHGSICCLHDLSATEFLLHHFPMPESETFLQIGNCVFTDFSSTCDVVVGHSNDRGIFAVSPSAPKKRFQDGRFKTQTSGCSKETVPPIPRAIGQSITCLEQLHPNSTGFLGVYWAAFWRRVVVLSWSVSQCQTPAVHTAQESAGECDLMSWRSGSVHPWW